MKGVQQCHINTTRNLLIRDGFSVTDLQTVTNVIRERK